MSFRYGKGIASVSRNILLITVGSMIFGLGVNAVIIPHGFVTGGISGVSLLLYYLTSRLSPGLWYFLINIPIFVAGWLLVSRRFFFYSLYGMLAASVAMDYLKFRFPIHDPFLAVLAGGAIVGAGGGITLHSLGSLGGNDIIAIILHQRLNLRIGTFYLLFNVVLFSFSFGVLNADLVLYSLALTFVSSQVLDHVLMMFNQRKMVLIITDVADRVVENIHHKLQRGATLLNGNGSYTGTPRTVILTVVHNYQLKRLEELVFTTDADAFMITENTFNVLGKGFSKRKVY